MSFGSEQQRKRVAMEEAKAHLATATLEFDSAIRLMRVTHPAEAEQFAALVGEWRKMFGLDAPAIPAFPAAEPANEADPDRFREWINEHILVGAEALILGGKSMELFDAEAGRAVAVVADMVREMAARDLMA